MAITGDITNAIFAGEAARVVKLLDQNPTVLRDVTGKTWLHVAVLSRKPEVVSVLVSRGNLDVQDEDGNTPLQLAIITDDTASAMLLVREGANVDAGGGRVPTVLSRAVFGDRALVSTLVERGADPCRSHDYPPRNSLLIAREQGASEIEGYLRRHGAVLPWETREAKERTKFRGKLIKALARNLGKLTRIEPEDEHEPVEVWLAPANEDRDYNILFTAGLGSPLPSDGKTIPPELCFLLPKEWPFTKREQTLAKWNWPITWLRSIIPELYLGRLKLEAGETLGEDPPTPLGPGTRTTALLCLHDPLGLTPWPGKGGGEVDSLGLLPIYTDELDYVKEHGFEALLQAFQKADTPTIYVPGRPSALAAKKGKKR
jgi:Suppressor of fused protein (SUFU)/Ankyrin repeat